MFTLQPISAAGELGTPNVVTLPSGYFLEHLFPEGDGHRVLLQAPGPPITATGRVGDGEIVDIEPLSDERFTGPVVSSGPGAFAVLQYGSDHRIAARLFARALPGGAACEAAWQCASASCESDSCTKADGSGGAGGEPNRASGEAGHAASPGGAGPGMPSEGGAGDEGPSGGRAGAPSEESGNPDDSVNGPAPDSSGCGCRAAGTAPASGGVPLLVLFIVGRVRRRRSGRICQAEADGRFRRDGDRGYSK